MNKNWNRDLLKDKNINSDKLQYICQCRNGHIFDYHKRDKFELTDMGFAPMQGKCPICKTTSFYFTEDIVYFKGKKKNKKKER